MANEVTSHTFTAGNPDNYAVTYVDGELTMSKADIEITVTAPTTSWTYDGLVHSDDNYVVTGTLLNGDEITVVITGSITDAGSVANVVSSVTITNGTEDVTGNYTINKVNGTLTVDKKAVTVTADSKNFTYDGNAHTESGYAVAGLVGTDRSEERRVGKECRSRWSPDH